MDEINSRSIQFVLSASVELTMGFENLKAHLQQTQMATDRLVTRCLDELIRMDRQHQGKLMPNDRGRPHRRP